MRVFCLSSLPLSTNSHGRRLARLSRRLSTQYLNRLELTLDGFFFAGFFGGLALLLLYLWLFPVFLDFNLLIRFLVWLVPDLRCLAVLAPPVGTLARLNPEWPHFFLQIDIHVVAQLGFGLSSLGLGSYTSMFLVFSRQQVNVSLRWLQRVDHHLLPELRDCLVYNVLAITSFVARGLGTGKRIECRNEPVMLCNELLPWLIEVLDHLHFDTVPLLGDLK